MRKASTKPNVAANESKPFEGPAKGKQEGCGSKVAEAREPATQLEPQGGPTERDQEEVVATLRNGWGVKP